MHNTHKVKLFKWVDGVLEWVEHHFHTKHEAIKFAEEAEHHVAKIFAPGGGMCFEIINRHIPVPTTDYA
jgi:hypothetical protein